MLLQMTQKEMDNMRHKYYHALVLVCYESYVYQAGRREDLGFEMLI